MRELVEKLIPVYGVREARAVMRAVLEDGFGLSYTQQCLTGIDTISAGEMCELEGMVQRLAEGEPVQYVTGKAWFCGFQLRVTPATLIPRPETEWIVEHVRVGRVLDIGTGSGCIAIGIASRNPEAEVWACDISTEALEVARGNALSNGVRVNFFEADMLAGKICEKTFDTIVSNPPYVCVEEMSEMAAWVLDHEPHTALFVPDDNPLKFYRAIARHGLDLLEKGGRMVLECNTRFAHEVVELLRGMGYGEAAVHDDCFGLPRFVTARL